MKNSRTKPTAAALRYWSRKTGCKISVIEADAGDFPELLYQLIDPRVGRVGSPEPWQWTLEELRMRAG